MSETGHHPGRAFIGQDGNFYLNGAQVLNDAGTNIAARFNDGETRLYPVPLSYAKTWDALQTNLPGTPANDDLGILANTWGTSAPTIESGDAKAATVTRYAFLPVPVPADYVAGQALTLRVNAGMKTTISDTSAALDAEVYRQAAPSTDICATAATSINSLTATDVDFSITPDDVVPGDLLLVRLKVAIVDGATGTAVIGKINSVTLVATCKA